MESWEVNFEWLRIRHLLKDNLKLSELPDLNVVLLFIGINEVGRWKKRYTKEEKQDLMHVAVCRLLMYDGYYEMVGRDADDHPHFRAVLPLEVQGAEEQEGYLKVKVMQYFKEWEEENAELERGAKDEGQRV